jgi:hypothetical protein
MDGCNCCQLASWANSCFFSQSLPDATSHFDIDGYERRDPRRRTADPGPISSIMKVESRCDATIKNPNIGLDQIAITKQFASNRLWRDKIIGT